LPAKISLALASLVDRFQKFILETLQRVIHYGRIQYSSLQAFEELAFQLKAANE
jgi:hypothetical protein